MDDAQIYRDIGVTAEAPARDDVLEARHHLYIPLEGDSAIQIGAFLLCFFLRWSAALCLLIVLSSRSFSSRDISTCEQRRALTVAHAGGVSP